MTITTRTSGAIPRTGLLFFCTALLVCATACVILPRRAPPPPPPPAGPTAPPGVVFKRSTAPLRVDINTAPAAALAALPGIGTSLAARIIEHRERYGPFRRAEHLLIVRGISERRFRELRAFIEVK